MTTREEDVLAARDPTLDDENDWEEFILTDVKVRFQGKTRLSSLLAATKDVPVCVTGVLEGVDEDQGHLVLDEDRLESRIQIDNVTHFAYGQHDDGEVGIWVAGRAGWFSVTPSKRYQSIYDEMVEAIDLFYFLAAKYRRTGKKRRNWNPKLEYLFEEYVQHSNGRCEDVEDAAEILYKHRVFLMTQMLEGREDIQWTSTLLCEHLAEKYPEEFAVIKERFTPESENKLVEDETTSEEEPSLDAGVEQAAEIYEVLVDMRNARIDTKRQLSVKSLAAVLFQRYDISDVEYSRNLILARADLLVEKLENEKDPDTDWTRRAIYKELKKRVASEETTATDFEPLRARSPRLDDHSEEESQSEASPVKNRRRRNRKSVLRPKQGNFSAKAAGKAGKKTTGPDSEAEEDEDEVSVADLDLETPSKVTRNQNLRDSTAPKINGTFHSIKSKYDGALNKTNTTNALVDKMLESAKQPTVAPKQVNGDQPPTFSTRTAPRQSPTPNGPNDTWICETRGCSKIVQKASSKRGQELIHDHFLVHAEDTQTKLELVMAEQRKHLPVSNLVERIRESATSQAVASAAAAILGPIEKSPKAKRVKRK